jgi:hypothetical protein
MLHLLLILQNYHKRKELIICTSRINTNFNPKFTQIQKSKIKHRVSI